MIKKGRFILGITMSILVIIVYGVLSLLPNDEVKADQNTCKVVRIIDGDTIVISIDGEDKKVRLIGIDTPESDTEEGSTATAYTKSILENKTVQLEYDIDPEDDYGRTLAYVYVDGEMINKILLQQGYAELFTVQPNVKYVEEFVQLQKEARQAGVGFWENAYHEFCK